MSTVAYYLVVIRGGEPGLNCVNCLTSVITLVPLHIQMIWYESVFMKTIIKLCTSHLLVTCVYISGLALPQ